MLNHLKYLLLFLCITPWPLNAQQNQTKPFFLGILGGNGHNCYGKFTVTKKWLTWNARFDKCIRVPYTVVEQKQEGKHIFIEFRIGEDAKCPFHLLRWNKVQKIRGLNSDGR